MIRREPPEPIRYLRDPLWEQSREFRRLVQELMDDPGATLPRDLSPPRRVAVEAEVAYRRWPSGSTRSEYRDAMERATNETRLRVAAPRSDTPTEDLAAAWLQPEGKELYERILAGVVRRPSSVPSLHCGLGTMIVAGGGRATPHILHAHDILVHNELLFGLVSELADSCSGSLRRAPVRRSYSQVTRRLSQLSEGLAGEAHITLAKIARELAAMGHPVGRYLAADGSLVPAWAPQRPAGGTGRAKAEREKRLRGRAPDAGFVIRQRKDGTISRAMRGYNLTTLIDLATEVVLAFDLRDATRSNESEILSDVLLPRVLDLSPDLSVRAVVGDKGFDNVETHKRLETQHRVHLVARRGGEAFNRRGVIFKEAEHPSIRAIRGDGVAICRAHGEMLEYKGMELSRPVARSGLNPDQPLPSHLFRSRFECPSGCGRPSVRTDECWSNLPYYPHTPNGRLDLFAFRRALLDRRGLIESGYSSLQSGYKQGLDCAARVRVVGREVQEALIALAFVTRALHALYAERVQRGEAAAA